MKIEYPIAKYTIMIHLHSHSSSVIKPPQAMGVTWLDSRVVEIFKNRKQSLFRIISQKRLSLYEKIGRAFGITEENFIEYFKTRRVEDDER